MKKNKPDSPSELRRRAEAHLRAAPKPTAARVPADDETQRLIHELEVHQFELETQNEELIRAREEVEVGLAQYADLYDFAPVGYATLRADGTIVQINLTGARLLGLDRALLVRRTFGYFVAEADRAKFNSLLEKVFDSGNEEPCEVTVATRPVDGRTALHLHVTASVSDNGEECRTALFDVTKQRQTEADLRMALKMDAIGRLAGGVAHDFNNLMTVILSYTGFALDASPEHEAIREDLLEVRNAAQRAAALTRQLLAFSRKQVLEPELVDMSSLASGLAKMLGRLIGEDIELVSKLAPDLWQVTADPGRLEQVIMNLAINARDAMAERGGTLTLETANVEGQPTADGTLIGRPGPCVMLAVSDTGSGMDENTMAHMFEPFFTTKEKDRGTGFGLSTVYGIIKQSNGSISVHSQVGRGTTFRIYLPRSTTEAARSRKQAVLATPAGGTETILVVEDEAPLRRVVKRILIAAGYTVLTACDGEDALRTCQEHRGAIDLALTDIVMPKVGGPLFAERVRHVRPETKILYMSGYPGDASGRPFVLDSGLQFIGKPFTTGALTEKVRAVLDLGREDRDNQRPERSSGVAD